jgi:hypothetical protein
MKKDNITPCEQFLKPSRKMEETKTKKSIPPTHIYIYMTAHFPGLIQSLQYKVTGLDQWWIYYATNKA